MHTQRENGSRKSSTLFACLFGVFIILHIINMWSPRIYPFTDVPNHLGLATIMRHYNEPDNRFNQFYEIDTTLKPNTFHIFFTSSKIFPSVEFGNKVFYCLYVFLLPVSVLFTIKKTGGNPWLALLSFLFLYNYNVSYGFIGFTIAIPFFFFTFALIPDYLQRNKIRTAISISALFLVLFFMHALVVLFALFVFFACTLYQKRNSFTAIIKKSSAALPAIILILYWWQGDSRSFNGQPLPSFIFDYYIHEYYQSLLLRCGLFILDNYALYDGIPGYCVAACFSLFVVLIIILSLRANKNFRLQLQSTTTPYLVIFLCCALACFLFMPLSLPGYGFLVQRFSVFIFLAVILFGSKLAPPQTGTLFKTSLCIAALLHFFCWFDYISDFNKENATFSKNFFSTAGNDALMGGLLFDNTFRGRPIYRQFTDYYIVWKKGIANTRLIDERSFPLRRKQNRRPIPPFIDGAKAQEFTIQGVDYLLVRGDIPKKAKKIIAGYAPENSSGEWLLFKYTDVP